MVSRDPCRRGGYSRRPELETAEDKLAFLAASRLDTVEFGTVTPDKDGRWLDQSSSDFDNLLPVASKKTKRSKTKSQERAIFRSFSLGVVTNRDDWVYADTPSDVEKRVRLLIDRYNRDRIKLAEIKNSAKRAELLDKTMKWTRAVKRDLAEGVAYSFDPDAVTTALYRPFIKRPLYFSPKLNEMQYLMPRYFGERAQLSVPSIIVTDPTAQKPWMTLATSICPDLHCVGAASGAVVLPLALNDGTIENVTDWALNRFREQYEKGKGRRKRPITKEAIFDYVYAVFHDPIYRKAYALDLKQDLPRVPLHMDFWQWAEWGKELISLHIDFEAVTPFGLKRVDRSDEKARRAGTPPKAILKGNRAAGTIVIDSETTLSGVPDRSWDYQLAGKCAIDWVLDQHKEKKPKDAAVLTAFGIPKLADRKQQLIELLGRVVEISVRTMSIVDAMEVLERDAEVLE